MTADRTRSGPFTAALLLVALCAGSLFVLVEARAASPLIPLAIFRNPLSSASLAMSLLISTVMMGTLVVGPFYLSLSLGLETAQAGLVLSAGPLVAAIVGVPAGRVVDRFGAQRMTLAALIGMGAGCCVLSMAPATLGMAGYALPISAITASYALFQAANNTVVMANVRPDQRGVLSGLLSLSRNLGLITGASVMGAVFAFASATVDIATAHPAAIATGMRTTFGVAAMVIGVALVIATSRSFIASRLSLSGE
jgi:MFS family permease